jgi:hypothetical protein
MSINVPTRHPARHLGIWLPDSLEPLSVSSTGVSLPACFPTSPSPSCGLSTRPAACRRSHPGSNTVNLNNPNTNLLGSTQFGRSTSQQLTREIQLGLKFLF